MDHAHRNREAALDFLRRVVAGDIGQAYAIHVDMAGTHHNPHFPAGFAALRDAMQASHREMPAKRLTPVNTVAEGDLVAVHSRLVLAAGGAEMAVVHLFRFQGGRITEMWDVGMAIPSPSPNGDGAF